MLFFKFIFLGKKPGEKPMKMMCTFFTGYRISSVFIKTGSYTFLNLLHNFLIFHFYLIQVGTRSRFSQFILPHITYKTHSCFIDGLWFNNINREAPGIKIK